MVTSSEMLESKIFRVGTVHGEKWGLVNHPFGNIYLCEDRGRGQMQLIPWSWGCLEISSRLAQIQGVAFLCYWQEPLGAIMGARSCCNTGMS